MLAALRGAGVRQRHSRVHCIALDGSECGYLPTAHSGTQAACDARQPRERVGGTVPVGHCVSVSHSAQCAMLSLRRVLSVAVVRRIIGVLRVVCSAREVLAGLAYFAETRRCWSALSAYTVAFMNDGMSNSIEMLRHD